MTRQKVVVPLDGSPFSRQVLPYVRQLLNPEEHQLVLLRAAEQPQGIGTGGPRQVMLSGMVVLEYQSKQQAEQAQHPIFASQIRETKRASLADELEQDAIELRRAGFEVSIEARFGDPAEEICAVAERQHVDFIVMATHGLSGLLRLVLGSVAEEVVRSSRIPVILVRPSTT
jgi:nucleotide-binding universal stress UspA family protein